MFYLPKPLERLSRFGLERLTGNDFLELVNACRIELILDCDVEKGYYYYSPKTKRHVIVLSTKISRAEREQVGWHEFAHFLQNYWEPVAMKAGYCKPENRNAREKMADGFAFVCVTGVELCQRGDFLKNLMDPESGWSEKK